MEAGPISSEVPLSVAVERDGDTAIVRVSGELDLAGAPLVRDAFRSIDGSAQRLVLDLAGLDFIDSVGLTLTLREQFRALAARQDFVVVGAGRSIMRVFRLAGIAEEVRFAPDVRSAG